YVVGYRPAALDGKFHKISVKVKRTGVAVRARKGYVATARPATTMLEPTPAPTASIAAADDATTVPVTTTVRLRPDSLKHVEALAATAPATAAASKGWEAYQRGDLE